VDVKTVRAGQRYTFNEADIADWMFMRNGKIVGNWTKRQLLKRMPKAQADNYPRMLELPLRCSSGRRLNPGDWLRQLAF